MRARTGRVGAALVTVALCVGCSIGDIRRPAPSAPPPAPARPTPAEVRQVRVPVARDYDRPVLQFVDGGHGYAQFVRCAHAPAAAVPDCSAILLATADGGRSWQLLRHPQPFGRNHQMYAAGRDIVLLAEPDAWYVSTDRGVTFRHVRGTAPPAAYHRIGGRFQVCCDGDEPPRIGEWVGDRFRPVPAQRPVPGVTSVAYDGRRLFVAGLHEGRPVASWSHDHGRTWWATAVAEPDGALSRVQLEVSRDDAWLVGYGPDDPTVFPQLWRAQGDRWEKVDVPGHPRRFTSVAPLGAGLLAVTGPDGAGVVTAGDNGARYNDLRWPVRDAYLQLLPDGTLFADGSDGTAWLGSGVFGERRWIKVVLERT